MQPRSRPDSDTEHINHAHSIDAQKQAAALSLEQIHQIVEMLARGNGALWRTQRSAVRHQVLCRALVWRSVDEGPRRPVHTQLVNISTGGIGLLAGSSLDARERVILETTIEGIGPIQWTATVAWCSQMEDGLFRIGARFAELHG